MSAETSTLAPFDKQVRKLRKKLRQIEKLQLSGRSLNEEETLKVGREWRELKQETGLISGSTLWQVKSRKSIRAELAQLLASTESLETTQPQAFTQNASAKTDLKVLDENLTSSIVKTTVIPDNLKNASFEEPEIKPGKQEVKTAQEATSLTESPTNLSTQEADTEEMKRQTSPSPGIASPSKKSKADAKTSAPAAKAPVPPTKTEPASQKKIEAPEQPAPLQIVDIETETDVLLCVDLDDLHIITGSRDTVVQVQLNQLIVLFSMLCFHQILNKKETFTSIFVWRIAVRWGIGNISWFRILKGAMNSFLSWIEDRLRVLTLYLLRILLFLYWLRFWFGLQVRDVATGRLLRDLRGHSNGVTAAVLLSAADSLDLAGRVPSLAGRPAESVRLAVTGSLDCCLKLWNVSDGAAAASIYTYGGITAVAYAAAGRCCLVGHESGKLEAYTFCVDDGVPATHPLYSINAFDDAISSIRVRHSAVKSVGSQSFWGSLPQKAALKWTDYL